MTGGKSGDVRGPAASTRAPGRRAWLRTLRLVHPFPSLVDGLVAGAVAAIAGAPPVDVIRLGLAMTSLQFAIGAVNDLADADADAGREEKPLASGAVTATWARTIAVAAAALGLGLAAVSGAPTLLLGVIGLSIGLAYDLRLKRTPWAWLPYVLGIPLIPVFGWVGATGSLPAELGVIAVLAGLAGGALSLANALVDPAGDAAVGVRTPVVVLGARVAWRALAALVGLVLVLAIVSLAVLGGEPAGTVVVVLGCVVTSGGLAVLRAGSPATRERGWEILAAGFATMAAGWVWAVAGLLAAG